MSKIETQGKIIIATPRITDLFSKTVVYIHSKDNTGAVGVMLNCPMETNMARKFANDVDWQDTNLIKHGGPVDKQLGYIIHSNDYVSGSSIRLNDQISYTGGKGIVHDINRGIGPLRYILLTGYCSWHRGQLEDEIDRGLWTVVDFDEDIIFQSFNREDGWDFAINVAAENKTSKLLEMVDTI